MGGFSTEIGGSVRNAVPPPGSLGASSVLDLESSWAAGLDAVARPGSHLFGRICATASRKLSACQALVAAGDIGPGTGCI